MTGAATGAHVHVHTRKLQIDIHTCVGAHARTALTPPTHTHTHTHLRRDRARKTLLVVVNARGGRTPQSREASVLDPPADGPKVCVAGGHLPITGHAA